MAVKYFDDIEGNATQKYYTKTTNFLCRVHLYYYNKFAEIYLIKKSQNEKYANILKVFMLNKYYSISNRKM